MMTIEPAWLCALFAAVEAADAKLRELIERIRDDDAARMDRLVRDATRNEEAPR